MSHANFIANMFNIPLQSAGGDSHAYTEQTLYKTLSDLFAYVFLDFDTLTSFALRASALKETKDLGKVVQRVVEKTRHDNFENVMEHLGLHNGVKENILQDFGTHLIKRLSEDGKSVDEVVWTIIPTAAAAVATQAQAVCSRSALSAKGIPANMCTTTALPTPRLLPLRRQRVPLACHSETRQIRLPGSL